MQIDDEVRHALDVLRRHAQGNDFELHRIDVLERDLTCPPTPEVVDERHQKFNGVIYNKQPSGHYHNNTGIHVAVWRYYHGNIPEDGKRYEVHHDDWNPDNNSASNLALLTCTEHRKIHANVPPPQAQPNCTKVVTCAFCGKVFTASAKHGVHRFCSAKCANAATLKKCRITPTHKKCKHCGKEFDSSHYKKVFCCDKCRRDYYHEKEKIHTRICQRCGKEFRTRTPSSIYCSWDCWHDVQRKPENQPMKTLEEPSTIDPGIEHI